jgi:hypothetical protein
MTIETPFTSNKRIPIKKIRLSRIFTDYKWVAPDTRKATKSFWLVEVKTKSDWAYNYHWKYDCESLARIAADELYAKGYIEVPVFEVEVLELV